MYRFQIFNSTGELIHSTQFIYASRTEAGREAAAYIMAKGDPSLTHLSDHL